MLLATTWKPGERAVLEADCFLVEEPTLVQVVIEDLDNGVWVRVQHGPKKGQTLIVQAAELLRMN